VTKPVLAWRRSTRCSSGSCVAVAVTPRAVWVRDDKDPDGPVLEFDRDAWWAFLDGLRRP